MSLDGIFLHHLTNELQSLVGCRVEKIHQPTRDELVILLRSPAFSGKLLISARSGAARLHITEASFDNPADPPAFCKLLRRHLSSAKITSIKQTGFDRTVIISFSTYNELGDEVEPFLALELITGKANIVLCNSDGRIFDALRRSDIESSARLVQPGAKYTLPEKSEKLDPLKTDTPTLADAVKGSEKPLSSAFVSTLEGVSPLISRELAFKTGADPDQSVKQVEDAALYSVLEDFKKSFSSPSPTLIINESGEPRDFCFMSLGQYGSSFTSEKADSFSSLLDRFYLERDRDARIRASSQDMLRLLTNLRNRIVRRKAFRADDLEKCKNRETFRIYGELLKANAYAIGKGETVARVQNYYDEELGLIDIPLDPALSPTANAAKYFKEYKKSYTAEQTLNELLLEDEKELAYVESLLYSLSLAKTESELEAIREELCEVGYMTKKGRRKPKVETARPKEYQTKSGFRILVGRNNRENDWLTTKFAQKHDLWFHTKNVPGSHVILVTEGKEPDEESLLFAASLAASHSKASKGDNVPVDFTEIKQVKKPSGAKPGMVIYKTNRTIYAKPNIFLVN